ncbi:hypothetical protein PM082_009221 [Marasmius tenuissimus]|nr:hypothetical protein PM082_009221 [Marasmius tenuissimus]
MLSGVRLLSRQTPRIATRRIPTTLIRPTPTPSYYAAMSSATTGQLDIAREIKLDHDNVRDLFERFKLATSKDEKGIIANTLIREMAVHSDSEEISVYNDLGKYGLEDTASHNREEHAEVKKLVYAADDASIDQADYDQIMGRAVTAFLEHAKEEEEQQLPKLVSKLKPGESDVCAVSSFLTRMVKANLVLFKALAREFLKARVKVPSRPHPSAPVSGGVAQKAAGMQGKFHDKIIETLGRRKFTDVKYAHPEV